MGAPKDTAMPHFSEHLGRCTKQLGWQPCATLSERPRQTLPGMSAGTHCATLSERPRRTPPSMSAGNPAPHFQSVHGGRHQACRPAPTAPHFQSVHGGRHQACRPATLRHTFRASTVDATKHVGRHPLRHTFRASTADATKHVGRQPCAPLPEHPRQTAPLCPTFIEPAQRHNTPSRSRPRHARGANAHTHRSTHTRGEQGTHEDSCTHTRFVRGLLVAQPGLLVAPPSLLVARPSARPSGRAARPSGCAAEPSGCAAFCAAFWSRSPAFWLRGLLVAPPSLQLAQSSGRAAQPSGCGPRHVVAPPGHLVAAVLVIPVPVGVERWRQRRAGAPGALARPAAACPHVQQPRVHTPLLSQWASSLAPTIKV